MNNLTGVPGTLAYCRKMQALHPCRLARNTNKRTTMEHLDTGTLENWYANRAMHTPVLLQRLAVIAPDDAPGLAALRQRLAQRSPRSLNCDHFAAGFNGVASASLASAFEQIRQRHATDPYDIVLLLEGRPEALGIAESNGLIPEQVSRMPVPVWTAIGEDDANTEIGDVANRVFPNPAALIDALPLQAAQPHTGAAAPAPAAARQPVATPVFSLVTTSRDAVPAHFPVFPRHDAAAPGRASAHPLVLCAAGAVIIASITAVAAMLGWLPSRLQANAGLPDRPAATVTVLPAAPLPAARVVNAADAAPAAMPAAVAPEPVDEPASLPPAPSAPQSSGIGEGAALAAAGAAGVVAAGSRHQAAAQEPAKRARSTPRRRLETPSERVQAPRQVGSTEVPVVDFVGTKSRQQVIAEMMEARRAANRQAGTSNYFSDLGEAAARR
jgi:hypothetical protein